MAMEFKLPDIGEGVAEGEVVKWLVKEGATITEDQPIVEIMTDKATVEIPSPYAGKVVKLLAKEGDVVLVGKGLLLIDTVAQKGEKTAAAPRADTPLFTASKEPPRKAPPSSSSSSGMVLASPATRRMAREMGVDLSSITGSGPGGRVTGEDLKSMGQSAVRAGAAQAVRAPSKTSDFGRRKAGPRGTEERIPLRGIRKKIAEAMARSKRTAAHFTHVDEVDMTQLVELRNATKADAEAKGTKLTYLPFIVRAICAGLKEYPSLNATLDEEKQEIVLKYYYNIGVAVATHEGDLVVPVIKDADQKSVMVIAKDIQTLAEKARANKLALEDIKGGTFTLTSTGNLGGIMATPIINFPEVAILGFHKIRPTPVVRDGAIVVRQISHLSLSLDHRVVDGAVAASFLNSVIRYLEDPKLLLLDA